MPGQVYVERPFSVQVRENVILKFFNTALTLRDSKNVIRLHPRLPPAVPIDLTFSSPTGRLSVRVLSLSRAYWPDVFTPTGRLCGRRGSGAATRCPARRPPPPPLTGLTHGHRPSAICSTSATVRYQQYYTLTLMVVLYMGEKLSPYDAAMRNISQPGFGVAECCNSAWRVT